MKTATLVVVLVLLCQSCQFAQVEKIELGESMEKHRYKQLRLYPVRANDAFLKQRGAQYLTLKEAVAQKKVLITERNSDEVVQYQQPASLEETPQAQQVVGEDAAVNSLFIENASSDTVLILGGEVVEGGNQDRTIAQDVILPPKSGKVDLSVFCVEHGRWNGDTAFFDVAEKSMAPASVRKVALEIAVQEKVWEEVDIKLSKHDVSAATSNVKELKQQAVYKNEIDDFSSALSEVFKDDDSVIGVIAVTGDVVIGCDLFESHELFMKFYPNLLQSWASQAIEETGQITVDRKMVEEYFGKVVMSKVSESGFTGEGMKERVVHLSTF